MKHEKWIWCICGAVMLGAAVLGFRMNSPRTVVNVTYQPEQELSAGAEQIAEPANSRSPDRKNEKAAERALAETAAAEAPEREPVYDLNAAEAEDLMRVDGIGETLAEAILAYRAGIGGFRRRAELTEIRGIGDVLAERIMEEFYIPDELPPETPDAPCCEQEDEPAPAEEPEEPEPPAETVPPEDLRFALNAVTYEQLMLLPDMKPEWAEGIISVREKLGGYLSMEELGLVDHLPAEYAEYVLRRHLYLEAGAQCAAP